SPGAAERDRMAERLGEIALLEHLDESLDVLGLAAPEPAGEAHAHEHPGEPAAQAGLEPSGGRGARARPRRNPREAVAPRRAVAASAFRRPWARDAEERKERGDQGREEREQVAKERRRAASCGGPAACAGVRPSACPAALAQLLAERLQQGCELGRG